MVEEDVAGLVGGVGVAGVGIKVGDGSSPVACAGERVVFELSPMIKNEEALP